MKLALTGMDPALRPNLAVGRPPDLPVDRERSSAVALRKRIAEDEPCFRLVRAGWSTGLRGACRAMPVPGWVPA